MTTENHDSISFILGLNQFQDANENEEAASGDTNPLLTGLNTLPSASPENPEEAVTNFANQLSLWTNASFSFDGPMGHALIGDEEKEPAKHDGNAHREDEENRVQRYLSASGAHSNAARDKNREQDRDTRSPSGPSYSSPMGANVQGPSAFPGSLSNPLSPTYREPPQHPPPPSLFPQSQAHPGLHAQDTHAWRTPDGDAHSRAVKSPAPGSASNQNWDFTSTLALQYLLSKNPGVLQNLPNSNGPLSALPPSWQASHAPSHANASQHGYTSPQAPVDPYQVLHSTSHGAPAMASSVSTGTSPLRKPDVGRSVERVPTSDFTFSSASHTLKPPVGKKRSSTSLSRSNSVKNEPTRENETDPSVSQMDAKPETSQQGRMSSTTERVKLVDTGNPEADAETNRLAIEEDKRRRNTAASARFRVKKKQREAALELSARELEAQVHELKQDNERLRTENEWLRRLITARPDGLSALLGASMSSHQFPLSTQPGLDMAHPSSSHMGLGKGGHEATPK